MLGAILAEHALDGLYKPEMNPDAYGQKDGQIVDKMGNPVPLYKDPSTVMRMLSPTAERYAGINAEAKANPLIAQQLESDRMFTPSYANEQNKAKTFGDTDAPSLVGTLGGQSDIAAARKNLFDSNAALTRTPTTNAGFDQDAVNHLAASLRVDPLVIQHSTNQLRTQLGQDPTEAQIADAVNKVKLSQANTDVQTAPMDAQSTVNARTIGNIMSSRAPMSPYFSSRLQNGQLMAPSRDPLGMSPMQAQMGSLQGIGNGSSMSTTTLPSGVVVNHPAPQYGESPTVQGNLIGQSSGSGPLSLTPKSVRMIDSVPGASADYSTGQIYYNGHQVTNNPNFKSLKQAAIEQGVKEQQDAQDAHHKAVQSSLKAQMDELKAQHLRSGLLPTGARMIGDAGSSVGSMFSEVGKWYGDKINNGVIQPASNYLIGK